jgi:hypothetical protein
MVSGGREYSGVVFIPGELFDFFGRRQAAHH